MCCPIDVGSVVIVAPKKCDRRMGNRTGIVKSKASKNLLIVAIDGGLLRVSIKRCIVIYGK